MATSNQLRIGLVLLDEDPVTAVWCDPCAVPSAITVRIALTVNDRPAGVITQTVCHDCGGTTP